MRRLYSEEQIKRLANIATEPEHIFEDELINNSEVQVALEKGRYLVELHQANATNIAMICVSEEGIAISTATHFNSGVAGAAVGCYHYDTMGNVLEMIDSTENIITVSGHIDIYRI